MAATGKTHTTVKLVSVRVDESDRVGLLAGDGGEIVDLSGVAFNMLDLVRRFAQLRPEIEERRGHFPVLRGREFVLRAPIPRPARNVFCVGKNYYEHAAEFGSSGFDSGSKGGDEVPDYPILFSKPPSSVIGPEEAINASLDPYDSVDYEAELAVIIGRSGRVTETDDPMDFVFGYTIINDVTSRELQKRHKQWLLGKGVDTFCPMGPAIVTADEFADLDSRGIRCFVNGEKRQEARIGNLIFDVPTLVRIIGRTTTLEPGDVIGTGTPVGVGIGFKPPRYLRSGDRVRIEVDGIGALENPVI